MTSFADFCKTFARLSATGEAEESLIIGGVRVRMVRVPGGSPGRWDIHPDTPETVVVWSGDFNVAFRDHSVPLSAGQCCVVPCATEHCGTSSGGAEVVLFTQVIGQEQR